MTSNLTFDLPGANGHKDENYRQGLAKHLRPEFVGRIEDIIFFNPLGQNHIKQMLATQLTQLNKRLRSKGLQVSLGKQLVAEICEEAKDSASGARILRHLFQKRVLDLIAERLIKGTAQEVKGDWILEIRPPSKILHWIKRAPNPKLEKEAS
jgi:ATP-dependent Clp protease ATP-binding subunit ClpB